MGDIEFSKAFDRGLNDEAVDAAAEFFSAGIGKELVDNKEFRVYIRKNYLDFYWNGCRVLNYRPLASTNRFRINRAYIQDNVSAPDRKDVSLTYEVNDLRYSDNSFRERILNCPEESLASWVKGSTKDSAGEKDYLYRFCTGKNSEPVLDVEVAFTMKRGTQRPHADRLDLAIVDLESFRLRFVEAKRDVDARLRSKEGEPKVISKMLIYRRFLKERKEDIVNSYKRVASNIHQLGLSSHFFHLDDESRANEWIQGLIESIEVDPQPRLMVFQTKEWNQNDKKHWDRLDNYLEENELPKVTAESTLWTL